MKIKVIRFICQTVSGPKEIRDGVFKSRGTFIEVEDPAPAKDHGKQ